MQETWREDLKQPFPESDLEWRVQSSGKSKDGKIWARVLTYVTNRAIQNRLDDVVGPENWTNRFEKVGDATVCHISIKVGGEWITKCDGAGDTQVEAVKGGLSAAMKRAAVQWGIGRYLYNLDAAWANCGDKGEHKDKLKDGTWYRWSPPALPSWALPKGSTPVVKTTAPPPDYPDAGEPESAPASDETGWSWLNRMVIEKSEATGIKINQLAVSKFLDLSASIKSEKDKKKWDRDGVIQAIIDNKTFDKFWTALVTHVQGEES